MPTYSITLPTSWGDLTDGQLTYVTRLMAVGYDPEAIAALMTIRSVPRRLIPLIGTEQLGVASDALGFLSELPDVPVRPSELAHGRARAADFTGETFADYLIMENLWSAVIDHADADALGPEGWLADGAEDTVGPPVMALLSHLWPGYRARKRRPWHAMSALLWMVGLHALYARRYPNLFRPTAETPDELTDQRELMETQIRALTGGDLTKREAILSADTASALAELDARAREAEEINRRTSSHKH